MKDREQPENLEQPKTEQSLDEAPATPMMDLEVFTQMRDVVRNHYLWLSWNNATVNIHVQVL